MQRRQQALLVVIRQALLPQRIEFVQNADLGVLLGDPVEHLNAFRLAHWQDQRKVVIFQCHRIKVQRAVARLLLCKVIEQRRQGGERDVVDLSGHQFQHVIVLLHLNQVAVIQFAEQQVLRGVDDFFHASGDELGTVMAEAAHLQRWLQRPARQVVEVIAQAVEQGVRSVETVDQHFVPAVERDLIEGQHEVLAHAGIAQRIGALGGHEDVEVTVMLERVDADVQQHQYFARYGGAQQRLFGNSGQGQGDALLQAAKQVEQFELAQVAVAGVQGQAGAAVDHAVAVAPGQQFQQFAAAFDRREMFPLKRRKAAVVQAPLGLSRLLLVARLHQGQGVFGQIRSDAGIDELDLVGLALECRLQPAAQHVEIVLVDQADGLLSAGKLGQEAIAVIELVDQRAALCADLPDFPLAAAIE